MAAYFHFPLTHLIFFFPTYPSFPWLSLGSASNSLETAQSILPFFFSYRFLSKPFLNSFPSLLLSVNLLPTLLFCQWPQTFVPSKEAKSTIY